MINKIKITSGCLVNGWHKLAQILKPNYEEIKQEIKYAESVYADETSWRQKGKLFWLWGFFSSRSALYIIRNTRSKKPILEILGKDFSGIIISDFWKPYISITSRLKQWCLAHYLREFKKVDDYRKYHPPSYLKFRKVVKRLFADAFKFSKLATNELEKQKAQTRFLNRLDKIISIKSKDPITERLKGRLRLFRNGLFTFITENVNPTNNYSGLEVKFGYDDTFDSNSAIKRLDVNAGLNIEGGKTNILVSYSKTKNDGLTVEERDFYEKGMSFQH